MQFQIIKKNHYLVVFSKQLNCEWKWGMCKRDNHPTKEQKTADVPNLPSIQRENLATGGVFS